MIAQVSALKASAAEADAAAEAAEAKAAAAAESAEAAKAEAAELQERLQAAEAAAQEAAAAAAKETAALKEQLAAAQAAAETAQGPAAELAALQERLVAAEAATAAAQAEAAAAVEEAAAAREAAAAAAAAQKEAAGASEEADGLREQLATALKDAQQAQESIRLLQVRLVLGGRGAMGLGVVCVQGGERSCCEPGLCRQATHSAGPLFEPCVPPSCLHSRALLQCLVRAALQEDRLSMTAAQAEQARLRAEQEAAQVGWWAASRWSLYGVCKCCCNALANLAADKCLLGSSRWVSVIGAGVWLAWIAR